MACKQIDLITLCLIPPFCKMMLRPALQCRTKREQCHIVNFSNHPFHISQCTWDSIPIILTQNRIVLFGFLYDAKNISNNDIIHVPDILNNHPFIFMPSCTMHIYDRYGWKILHIIYLGNICTVMYLFLLCFGYCI